MSIRSCLKCANDFISSGPENRLCLQCNRHNSQHLTMKIYPDPMNTTYRPDPPPELPTALEQYGQEKTTIVPKSDS